MDKVILVVLGNVVTPENLIDTKNKLKQHGITLNIVEQSSFNFELLKNDNLGMNIITHYNGNDEHYKKDETREHNNVTELHFNYDGRTYAIESDIHSTGRCPHKGNKITDKIVVTLETEVKKEF